MNAVKNIGMRLHILHEKYKSLFYKVQIRMLMFYFCTQSHSESNLRFSAINRTLKYV